MSGEGEAQRLLVVTVEEYLTCFLPSHTELSNLYTSLSLSFSSSSAEPYGVL